MKIRTIISFVCYLLVAIILAIIGFRYLLASEFMPYHSVALGVNWSELGSRYQILFLALMRVAGSGMLASGVAIGFLLFIPFRKRDPWARWAILAIGLIIGGSTVYATLSVKFGTPASPPWILSLVGVVLTVVGSVVCPSRPAQETEVEADESQSS